MTDPDAHLLDSFDRYMRAIGKEGTKVSEAEPIIRVPEKIDIAANSPEWLALRKKSIGASDSPVILRVSPFQEPFSLYLNKIGEKDDKKANEQQQHGHDTEAKALEAYIAQTGNFCSPVMLRMKEWPEWYLAKMFCDHLTPEILTVSTDGYSAKKRLTVEIKCPIEIGDHITAREGHVPEKYWPQLQHNLLVSDAVRCDYVSFFRDECIVIPVTLDRAYVAEELIPKLDEFWGWVKNKSYLIPAKDSVCTFEGEAELKLAQEAAEALAMMKAAEESFNAVKAKLMRYVFPYAKSIIGEIEVLQTYRKGSTYTVTQSPSLSFTIRRAKHNGK
jgi:putative phage-type endonuclease